MLWCHGAWLFQAVGVGLAAAWAALVAWALAANSARRALSFSRGSSRAVVLSRPISAMKRLGCAATISRPFLRRLVQLTARVRWARVMPTFAELIAADAPNPAQENARTESSTLVAACMEQLDASHREILTLRNVLNRSYEEIATALNLNVGTVKSRIARARQNLRARLAEACPEFSADAEPSEWFEPVRALGRLSLAKPLRRHGVGGKFG
eukprot:gene14893-19705_t